MGFGCPKCASTRQGPTIIMRAHAPQGHCMLCCRAPSGPAALKMGHALYRTLSLVVTISFKMLYQGI